MLTGTGTRGNIDPESIAELTEDDVHSVHDMAADEWIGEIITIPHPNSGHMGKSMAKVIAVETTEVKEKTNPMEAINGEADPEYEMVEADKLIAEDLLLNKKLTVIQHSIISASFVEDGETYSVYGLQHKNGRGEWVNTAHYPGKTPWAYMKPSLESLQDDYKGHEETRIVEYSVTHHRTEDAHPSDTDGYTLDYTTTPVLSDVSEPQTDPVHKQNA